MDGTAVKQIAEMQSRIENLEWDMITILAVVNDPEAAKFYPELSNPSASEIITKIIELHKK